MNDEQVRTALDKAAHRRDHDKVRCIALEYPAVALVWIDESRSRARLKVDSITAELKEPGITPEDKYLKRRALLRTQTYLRMTGPLRQEVQLRLGEVNRGVRGSFAELREAIRSHMIAAMENDFEPEDHDRRLWAMVESTSFEELRAQWQAAKDAGHPWRSS